MTCKRHFTNFSSDFGLDYKHWYIEIKKPEGNPTRDEIIDMYVKMLASVVGRYIYPSSLKL